jgi:hypothetical protein
MPKIRALILVLALCVASLASAFESRFEVDAQVSLEDLATQGTPYVVSGRTNGAYWADASAVLSQVDVAKLFAAAQDYDDYVQFGMPYLNESHVVERESAELLYTWASMTYSIAGIDINAEYYLEARIHPDLDSAGARGMEWQVVPRKANWPYEDDHPRFDRNDGSFYIQPLADGRAYVRYFITSDIEVPLGRFGRFFGGDKIIQGALRKGAGNVITALAKQAAVNRRLRAR